MIEKLTSITGTLSGILWNNVFTLAALLGIGAYLTVKMGFIQFRGFKHSVQLIQGKHDKPDDVGEVSHFQALSTALSATVGTGNIAGVAAAITLGGPGALFWMWVTAFFGMATKFAECSLSVKFREISPSGEVAGGPMYTLLHGLNQRPLAIMFASFALIASFGIGNMVQANSVVDGLAFINPAIKDHRWLLGAVMAVIVGLVIIGGVKRIAKVASILVPFMAVIYVGAALIVLIKNFSEIPRAIGLVFNNALNIWAVGGAAVGEAIRWGVARGLFSNEAGLGSSPMAHAAAKTNEPVREGLVAMLEPFIDTLIICTLTGLVILTTNAIETRPSEITGAAFTAYAFEQSLGGFGSKIVGIGLMLFAFSTTIAWSYYGDRAARFLFGEKAVLPYRIVYSILVMVGAAIPLKLVWNLADITNILMAIPNLIALVFLAGLVKKMKNDYFSKNEKPQ